MTYSEQIQRIKEKLEIVKSLDTQFEIFGANSHKYYLDKPASQSEIAEFESKYNIELPSCFKTFISEVGNGGIEYPENVIGNSAAGPHFGIYKLGNHIDVLFDSESGCLQRIAFVDSNMIESEWRNKYDELEENISDEDFDKHVEKVFSGILIIGFCGCSGYQGIILNGKDKGRIVYLYEEVEYCPEFTKEINFLDWYENWLNEIINNKKFAKKPIKSWWKIW